MIEIYLSFFKSPAHFIVKKEKITNDGLSKFEKRILEQCLNTFYFKEDGIEMVNIKNITKCVSMNYEFLKVASDRLLNKILLFKDRPFTSSNQEFTNIFLDYLAENQQQEKGTVYILDFNQHELNSTSEPINKFATNMQSSKISLEVALLGKNGEDLMDKMFDYDNLKEKHNKLIFKYDLTIESLFGKEHSAEDLSGNFLLLSEFYKHDVVSILKYEPPVVDEIKNIIKNKSRKMEFSLD